MPIENIFIPISIILIILIVVIGYLIFQNFKFKRRLDLFFRKGGKDLEEVLGNLIKKLEGQETDLKKNFEEISRLNQIAERSFQKIGVVRFNPFKDVGGDQSFSIALLDLNNNGFVITSLYGREGNRIYAKPINNGKSEYSLSEEEIEAIEKAKGQNDQ